LFVIAIKITPNIKKKMMWFLRHLIFQTVLSNDQR
jgi:hypothetical protein